MNSNINLQSLLAEGREYLKKSGITSYMLDAEVLLQTAASLNKIQVLTNPNYIIPDNHAEVYRSYLQKRAASMPVKYIIGICEFMSLEFCVNDKVLLPRPDTEILVESAINIIKKNKYKDILEIGTGSGCISISLAYYMPNVKITASDIDKHAIETAKHNANVNNCKVHFIQSNLFESITERYDLVISNPPYIATSEIAELPADVKDYEPLIALDGGIDGLDFYREICLNASKILKQDGALLLEIGYNQAEAVTQILKDEGFVDISVKKDLAGLDRVMIGFTT